jgi:hypothetical protein
MHTHVEVEYFAWWALTGRAVDYAAWIDRRPHPSGKLVRTN